MNNFLNQATSQLQDLIMSALGRAVADETLPAEPIPAFNIEIPSDTSHGDFACNVAMISARAFKKAPRQIAQAIVDKLDLEHSYFVRAEIAGPGFLNFFVADSWFSSTVKGILADGKDYGRSDYGQDKKVMVEFVSANPTGPMHIGNARGGALGDCLAEALDWAGYQVTREFYVNDAGNQLEKFKKSLSIRYQQLFVGEENAPLPEDAYQGQDIVAHAKAFAKIHGDSYLNSDEDERKEAMVEYALPKNIEALRDDLGKYRIFYDKWFLESTLHEADAVNACIALLTERGLTYVEEGAVFYKASEFGAEKDEVLVRANGIPTYFAADIAYHYNKFAVRGFDKVINVWGADHHGHVARLKGAMDAVGLSGDKLDIVLMQLVKLMRDGELVKVSKRTGKSITLVDLLDEVPVDAARFFFNTREANTQMDFDLGLAVEKSSENPVYYVQYAHARICSILAKLERDGVTAWELNAVNCDLLATAEERELIRFMAKLPDELIEVARHYDSSRMTKYAVSLAQLFHKFYNACHVQVEDKALMQARLALCKAVQTTLQNVLSIIKVDAPTSM